MPAPDNTYLFVDGDNIYFTLKAMGVRMDWLRLSRAFPDVARFYYCMSPKIEEDGHIPMQAFLDKLEYNGWTIIRKDAKTFDNGRTWKQDISVDLTVEAMGLRPSMGSFILFAGATCYVPLVLVLKSWGVKTVVVSSVKTSSVSDELRRAVDVFMPIEDVWERVTEREVG